MNNLDYLEHHGVKGMRWGHSKVRSESRSFKRELKKGLPLDIEADGKGGVNIGVSQKKLPGQSKNYKNDDVYDDYVTSGSSYTSKVNKRMLKGMTLDTARRKTTNASRAKFVGTFAALTAASLAAYYYDNK